MTTLFVFHDEVSRRSILPILDIFIKNQSNCKVLVNNYSINSMNNYSEYFICETDAARVCWQFIISANPIKKGKFKGKLVSIPHGSMFGNTAWSLNRALHADIYFGISPYELPYIKRHLKNKFNEDNFIAAGNPANDFLINFMSSNDELRIQKRNFFGLDNQKIILLSSHWTSLGNLRKFGTGLLDAIVWNFPEYQVICTCHPKLITSPKSEFRINKGVITPYFDADWLIKSLQSRQSNKVKIILSEATPAELLFMSDFLSVIIVH